jgi:hypothetical protein
MPSHYNPVKQTDIGSGAGAADLKKRGVTVQVNDVSPGLKLIINIRNYFYLCEMCIFGTGI